MTPPDLPAPVSGPSYSLPIRVAATLIVLVVLAGALRWWRDAAMAGWGSQEAVVLAATLFGTIGAWFFMLRSVTVVDAEGIRQIGLVNRNARWSQVASVRMPRWGTTRLIVRRAGGPFFSVFHGGSAELRAAFRRVAGAHHR